MTELLQSLPGYQQSDKIQSEGLAKTVRLMDKLHASEYFTTPEQAKSSLNAMEFEDFDRLLSQVNGMERGIPHAGRGMQGSGVIGDVFGVCYYPPAPSARRSLVKEAFEHAKHIESPEKAGLMLGMTINAVHPYNDGNGRASRLVYGLLSKDYDGSPEGKIFFTDLLQNTSGRKVIDANPANFRTDAIYAFYRPRELALQKDYPKDALLPTYIFGGYRGAYAIADQAASDLKTGDDVSTESQDKLHAVLRELTFAANSLMRVLPHEQVLAASKSVGRRTFIEGDKLLPGLTEQEINDINDAWGEEKINYIHMLIHIFDNPKYARHMEEHIKK